MSIFTISLVAMAVYSTGSTCSHLKWCKQVGLKNPSTNWWPTITLWLLATACSTLDFIRESEHCSCLIHDVNGNRIGSAQFTRSASSSKRRSKR